MSRVFAWIGDHLLGRFGDWLLRRYDDPLPEWPNPYERTMPLLVNPVVELERLRARMAEEDM